MLIRSLKTFAVWDGQQAQVFNAGDVGDLRDDLALEKIEEGFAEADDDIAAQLLGEDGEPVNPPAGDARADTMAALRADYREALGKAPFNGWNADELRKRIDAAGDAPPA